MTNDEGGGRRARPGVSAGASPQFGRRVRFLAATLPVVVPVTMTAAFTIARDRLGARRGYAAGFAVYWATCAGLSLAILGPAGIRGLVRREAQSPRSGPQQAGRRRMPRLLAAALLAWPPAGAITTRFLPEVRTATPPMIATIGGVALANAVLEELLWRGVFLTLWPDDAFMGWIWPSVGFGLWHVAPQVIHPSSLGTPAYVGSATALGLSWGWVAWRTGAVRAVGLSHVLTDGAGLRNARFFLED